MSLVLVTVTDGLATVTLNRPEKINALTRELCQELIAALRRVSGDPAVRVIIVTGAGRAFCAGADLTILGSDGDALVAGGKEIALLIRGAPQPVIAAVNGAAAGGGANLALACDYRLAADTATIGQVFARLGLGPDWGGSYFLPRLVGPSRALELLFSARMVPAAEALTLGLFDRVVPADRLTTEAQTLAAAWATFPALALRRAKEAIYRSTHATLLEMLDYEIDMQHELFATPDARARLDASLATRSR
ncbi:MAG TPA: enoyl-CoA hydratase-related protein [bacterium]|jgi:2-(1,2-epoxy-1,2-dihydrophenyl)acetyl-CoA isomerase|nr:enoyl-CoA hydratase-related protein [bacterium]